MITLSYYMPNESPYAVCINLDSVHLYFSYDQIVAYSTEETGLIVSENIWTRTHGKHIKRIMGLLNTKQVPAGEFKSRLCALMRRLVFAYNHLELMRLVEESNEGEYWTESD